MVAVQGARARVRPEKRVPLSLRPAKGKGRRRRTGRLDGGWRLARCLCASLHPLAAAARLSLLPSLSAPPSLPVLPALLRPPTPTPTHTSYLWSCCACSCEAAVAAAPWKVREAGAACSDAEWQRRWFAAATQGSHAESCFASAVGPRRVGAWARAARCTARPGTQRNELVVAGGHKASRMT